MSGQRTPLPPTPTELASFRRELERFVEIARNDELIVKPYGSADLPGFCRLAPEARNAVSAGLAVSIAVAERMRSEQGYLKRNLNGIWYTLKHCGLIPNSDVFDRLEAEDIIEIFTADGIQIYRSLQFFETCTYDLDTLMGHSFLELYTRGPELDESIGLAMSEFSEKSLARALTLVSHEHPCEERMSSGRSRFLVQSKIVSPLKNREGRLAGFLHSYSARYLGGS